MVQCRACGLSALILLQAQRIRGRTSKFSRKSVMLPSRQSILMLPLALRAFVRSTETGLVFVAILVGITSGVLVSGMNASVLHMHAFLFGLDPGDRLSASQDLVWWRTILVPVLGGCVLGLTTIWIGNRYRNRLADAIEANALHGGRISFRGSVYLSVQTLLSSGFGASVGLEAGYTQICAATASWAGRVLNARRSDMRLLVACGASGAIGAAFGAPLAGTFFAFEVVLGSYSVSSLVPVVASALAASYVSQFITGHDFLVFTGIVAPAAVSRLTHIVIIGLVCSAGSILLMEAVAIVERLFARSRISPPLRPVVGGLYVGLLAIATPQVLGSGHGALQLDLIASASLQNTLLLLALKFLAAAVSLGSGFRGGLFFASLLLGALVGQAYAFIATWLDPFASISQGVASLAGMAALGTGVVGAPVTMTLLALELTGDFYVASVALLASAISSLIVRETFGYSFATWRFHLRGEAIRGPHDVGWVRDLTVEKLMRTDVRTVSEGTSVREAREMFPLGSTKQIAAIQIDQTYSGIILLEDLYSLEDADKTAILRLARYSDDFLLPKMTIQQAFEKFRQTEADALAVLNDVMSRRIIGLVSEAHILRRYGDELERRNMENGTG